MSYRWTTRCVRHAESPSRSWQWSRLCSSPPARPASGRRAGPCPQAHCASRSTPCPPGRGRTTSRRRATAVWYTAQGVGQARLARSGDRQVDRNPARWGSAPHGVIVGPDGAAWVTDGGLNAIVRVDHGTPRSSASRSRPERATRTSTRPRSTGAGGSGSPARAASTAASTRARGAMRVFDAPARDRPVRHHDHAGRRGLLRLARRQPHRPHRPRHGQGDGLRGRRRAGQGARRVWSDSRGRIWVSEWNAGQVARYDPAPAAGRVAAAGRRHRPMPSTSTIATSSG